MTTPALLSAADDLLAAMRATGLRVATAESCTGGLIAATLTAVAGSSDVFDRGFVTYSNDAKVDLLGVSPGMIDAEGAVSEAVAGAMAAGALIASAAQRAVAVTGVAGPGGGSAEKPVGLVWFGLARDDGTPPTTERHVFPGNRTAVREATVAHAFAMLSASI